MRYVPPYNILFDVTCTTHSKYSRGWGSGGEKGKHTKSALYNRIARELSEEQPPRCSHLRLPGSPCLPLICLLLHFKHREIQVASLLSCSTSTKLVLPCYSQKKYTRCLELNRHLTAGHTHHRGAGPPNVDRTGSRRSTINRADANSNASQWILI